MSTSIKAGDLLYAVGPGNPAPRDLQIYSTPVERVRLEGSFSLTATPADFEGAVAVIELGDRRSVLGFPKCCYLDHEVGVTVHRSAVDAVNVFYAQAIRRKNEAQRAHANASKEVEWAVAAARYAKELP